MLRLGGIGLGRGILLLLLLLLLLWGGGIGRRCACVWGLVEGRLTLWLAIGVLRGCGRRGCEVGIGLDRGWDRAWAAVRRWR